MDENMCYEKKNTSKTPPMKCIHRNTSLNISPNCYHRCNKCSAYSSSVSTLSSTSSSLQSLSSASETSSNKDSVSVTNKSGCLIQQHFQSIFALFRKEETLKMAIRLESSHPSRTRYLVIVSHTENDQPEECCLLGIDCNQSTTVGLVLKVLANTAITLDGDGGFSVSVCDRQHIFKPVSVQAMWSALQNLYKCSHQAREYNYYENGISHQWIKYYENSIKSDRSCLNEWNAMNDIESRRPPSPDSLRSRPRVRLEAEEIMRRKLREIMMSVDIDEVTSKYIRSRLEEELDMDLREYKSFIDKEILVILGQMDEASEVFSHVYLGSEWNASNLEELNKKGICHILNVTREIDNFFPGTCDYLNIRVYDDDNTDLMKHWDDTYKYIDKIKNSNAKVLVHCKMGISRSASVVIAYAMKAYGWDFKKSFDYVRKKRTCINPNQNFINQLETYQGILNAIKHKEKLQRSKSETNLKSSPIVNAGKRRFLSFKSSNRCTTADNSVFVSDESSSVLTTTNTIASTTTTKAAKSSTEFRFHRLENTLENKKCTPTSRMSRSRTMVVPSSSDRSSTSSAELSVDESSSFRPKSWSPDNVIPSSTDMFNNQKNSVSHSLEHLDTSRENAHRVSDINDNTNENEAKRTPSTISLPRIPPAPPLPPANSRYSLNFGMHCENGSTYSVSPNKIMQLYSNKKKSEPPYLSSFHTKHIPGGKSTFYLMLPSQFRTTSSSKKPVIHENVLVKKCSPNEWYRCEVGEIVNEETSAGESSPPPPSTEDDDVVFKSNQHCAEEREHQQSKSSTNDDENKPSTKFDDEKNDESGDVGDKMKTRSIILLRNDAVLQSAADAEELQCVSSSKLTTETAVFSPAKQHSSSFYDAQNTNSPAAASFSVFKSNERNQSPAAAATPLSAEDESKKSKVLTLLEGFEALSNATDSTVSPPSNKKEKSRKSGDGTAVVKKHRTSGGQVSGSVSAASTKPPLAPLPTPKFHSHITAKRNSMVRSLVGQYDRLKGNDKKHHHHHHNDTAAAEKGMSNLVIGDGVGPNFQTMQQTTTKSSKVALVKSIFSPSTATESLFRREGGAFSKLKFCQSRNSSKVTTAAIYNST